MDARTFVSFLMIAAAPACGGEADTSRSDTSVDSAEATSEPGDTSAPDVLDSEEADDATDASAPKVTYVFHAEASGEDVDLDVRAECLLDALIDDVVETVDGFTGSAHGEVFRNVFPDTRRFEFQALMAGAMSLTRTRPAEADLRMVGEHPDDASRFWLAIEVLAAVEGEGGDWFGTWQCQPIDVDYGTYTDDQVIVEGTWTLDRIVSP